MARSRVELFEAIRRDHRRDGLSIRALADRHGVHRCGRRTRRAPVTNYTTRSCDIDLSSIADFTALTQVAGCGTTVTMSVTVEKRSVPNSWATWGSPPDTETATPNLLYSGGATSLTVDFGKKVKTGGFEVEPDLFQVETIQVDFYSGANGTGTLVGSITRSDLNGSAGAKLFGGHRRHGFKSAIITDQAGDDFGIAQIRV